MHRLRGVSKGKYPWSSFGREYSLLPQAGLRPSVRAFLPAYSWAFLPCLFRSQPERCGPACCFFN